MKDAIILIPFAYGGNPGTESGPRAILDKLMDAPIYDSIDIVTLQMDFTESPNSFLQRCIDAIICIIHSHNKCCFIGGNHLSIYPVYLALTTIKKQMNIIVADAHRDYYPSDEITHASFLSRIPYSKTRLYFYGARDFHLHSKMLENARIINENYEQKLQIQNVDFLDIDVDVFDDAYFPYYCDFIPHGISKEKIVRLIDYAKERECKVMAVSEYMPYYDNNMVGAEEIIKYIGMFLYDIVLK